MRQTIHRNFHNMVEPLQLFGRQSQAFVADDEYHLAWESKLVDRFGVARLLQTDERVTVEFELLQNWRQRPVNLELHCFRAIAGDSLDDLGRAASNDASYPATASGAENMRDVDVASQRGAGNDQLSRTFQRTRGKMTQMFESSHKQLIPKEKGCLAVQSAPS